MGKLGRFRKLFRPLSARMHLPLTVRTTWAGKPCACRRVMVIVGEPPTPPDFPWYFGMEGKQRRAVEVITDDEHFVIDDEAGPYWNEGEGWSCVTSGAAGLEKNYHGYKALWPEGGEVLRELEPHEYPKPFVPMTAEQEYIFRGQVRKDLQQLVEERRARAQEALDRMRAACVCESGRDGELMTVANCPLHGWDGTMKGVVVEPK